MGKMTWCALILSAIVSVAFVARANDRAAYPKIVAHAGGGDLTMPPASRAAYSNAVASANDIVKLDLQRTRDGVVVMGHDPTLDRVMGWKAAISDFTHAEILERGTFLPGGGFDREKIVTLDEALSIVRTVPEFWIDFKHFDPAFAEKVVETFDRHGIGHERIMVATFTFEALDYFKTRHPEIRRVAHVEIRPQPDGTWFANTTGERYPDRRSAVRSALLCRDRYGLFGVNMPTLAGETTPEDVAWLRRAGLWVSVWFVQDARTAAIYRDSGADAYVSDFISQCRKGLDVPARTGFTSANAGLIHSEERKGVRND